METFCPTGTYFGRRVLKHFNHKHCLTFLVKYLNQFSIKLLFKIFTNLDLKCFNTTRDQMFQYPPIVYYRRTLYNSTVNITFFSSSDMHQSHHLSGCHAIGINSSFYAFLSAFGFSNLIYQARNLIRISISKLSSKLILLKSILRKPISLVYMSIFSSAKQ